MDWTLAATLSEHIAGLSAIGFGLLHDIIGEGATVFTEVLVSGINSDLREDMFMYSRNSGFSPAKDLN